MLHQLKPLNSTSETFLFLSIKKITLMVFLVQGTNIYLLNIYTQL